MRRALYGLLLFSFSFVAGCEDEVAASYEVLEGDGDSLPELPSPFTAEETTALRTAFDWASTTELIENDEQGRPAYYYALILVGSREQADLLELARIYHDPMPLFPEELARWDEAGPGIIDFAGDDHGTFAFSLVAGAV